MNGHESESIHSDGVSIFSSHISNEILNQTENLMKQYVFPFILFITSLLYSSPVAAQEQILIVVTNNTVVQATIDGKDSTIAGGYTLSEVTQAFDVFIKSGFTVDFMSPHGGMTQYEPEEKLSDLDKAFINNPEIMAQLKNTLSPKQINASEYNAIYFAGGKTLWDFPNNNELASLTASIYEQGGVVGAICHGPGALLNVTLSNGDRLIEGKNISSFTNLEEQLFSKAAEFYPFMLQDELTRLGATYQEAPPLFDQSVVDGRLVTGQNPLFTPEDSYAAVYAASLEALSAGVTTMNNWAHNLPSPEHADAELQAMEDAGLRGQFTYGYHYELSPEEPMNVADAIRLRDSSASKRMTFRLGLRNDVTPDPNFPFFKFLNVAPALLKKEIAMAREARLPISMHVLNEGNAEYYAKAGYLNSDNLIIHGYHWDDADWKVLADHQTPVSFSPSTANGMRKIIPLTSAQKNGVQCGLSFDNYAGSGGPNMFKMMAAARINQQLGKKKISDSKLLSLVTKNGAGVLGISDDVGTITPGKQADFMLVKTDSLAMAPAKDSVRALTNTANPSDIDSVYVDGTPVKRNGKMLGIHTADIANDLNSRFERLIRLMN
jgi:cytosine/adenosine deaminase-related metal-dependent hydrolase